MFLNPRADLFNFRFSQDFIPKEINDRYYDYLNNVVGHPISKPIDYINYSSASNPLTLTQLPGTPKAVLTAYSDGTYIYGNMVLMY